MNISNIELNDLQFFPYHLKNRNKELKNIKIKINDINKTENGIIISGTDGKYLLEVLIQSNKISLNSPIKIFCNCPSFNFEFAHLLNDQKALLNEDRFKKAILFTPKEKNKHNSLCGCKHIIAFCRFIYKHSTKINNQIN